MRYLIGFLAGLATAYVAWTISSHIEPLTECIDAHPGLDPEVRIEPGVITSPRYLLHD